MTIQHLPSFWNYIGEGASGLADVIQQSRERKSRENEMYLRHLMDQYNSGSVDSATVNAFAQRIGSPIHVQQSPQELRRLIMSQPGGPTPSAGIPEPMNRPAPTLNTAPTSMSTMQNILGIGQAGLGTLVGPPMPSQGVGGSPPSIQGLPARPAFNPSAPNIGRPQSPMPDIPANPKMPWSEDQLNLAGLPTDEARLLGHMKQRREMGEASEGLKYINGESVSDQTAAALGKPTMGALAVNRATEKNTAAKAAASGYGSTAFNMALPNMKSLDEALKLTPKLVDVGFNAYLTDNKGMSPTDPDALAVRKAINNDVLDTAVEFFKLNTPRKDTETRAGAYEGDRTNQENINKWKALDITKARILDELKAFDKKYPFLSMDPNGLELMTKVPGFTAEHDRYLKAQGSIRVIERQQAALGVMPGVDEPPDDSPTGLTKPPGATDAEWAAYKKAKGIP